MTTTCAWQSLSKGQLLELKEWRCDAVGPNEVEVRIDVCGLCHTDIHMIDNDWGISKYPQIPGHEGIGHVVKVGKSVSFVKIGDRVGVAWIRDSCRKCTQCSRGKQNLCDEGYHCLQPTVYEAKGGRTCGAFARNVVVHEMFAFPIPDSLSSVGAAPLLCAGVTVYSPIREYWKPGMTVGVIGIGGLGHLAVLFAKHLGAEVWAFDLSREKEEDVLNLGADHYVQCSSDSQMASAKQKIDLVIQTSSGFPVPNEKYVGVTWPDGILKNGGVFMVVGLEPYIMQISSSALTLGQKEIGGKIVGGRQLMLEMLNFCAKHRIMARVEEWPFDRVNEAIEHVRLAKAKFRVILKF